MNKYTYISLFSSAGVGCYGFKMNNFRCIASNELLAPRISVQKANEKCEYDTGYICGDITKQETHDLLFEEINKWKELEGINQVDVVFATPPCQGMSTVNYKKNDHEQIRNSLVVQAIKLIKEIHPKVFVFENVRAFMKSVCTDVTGKDMPIEESIFSNLSSEYNIYWKIVNFKDFGVPSSRPRTLVIGTSRKIEDLSPLNIFPTRHKEITLREIIGDMPHLEFGEKDKCDPFHFARPFPTHQIEWISDLVEGQSAFDKPLERQPYKILPDGSKVRLKGAYMGNKYRRLFWDRPGACIATRNDVLSSQDTIHPCDDRVLSIRELMKIMTIPNTFKWTTDDDCLLPQNSTEYLKKNEMNIRRCIGEAVPTEIMRCISSKIRTSFDYADSTLRKVDLKDNFYYRNSSKIKNQVEVYNEICKMEPDKQNVVVRIDTLTGFFSYIPQLMSYYALSDNIKIVVAGLTKKEQKSIEKELSYLEIGENVEIVFADVFEGKIDFVIDDKIKVYEVNRQMSLFD